MASFNLGQVVMVFKGTYSSTTTYQLLNVVSYNGGAFVCIQAGSGHTPGTSGGAAYWASLTRGVQSISVASAEEGTATMTITLSDGTTTTNTFATTGTPDGSITLAKLASGFTLPVVNGGTGATTAAAARTNLVAQKLHTAVQATVTAAAWSGTKTQVVSVNGVTASNTVVVSAAPASLETWQKCNIRCTIQATNKLTFECDAVPTADVTVNVLIMEVS